MVLCLSLSSVVGSFSMDLHKELEKTFQQIFYIYAVTDGGFFLIKEDYQRDIFSQN